MRRVRFTIGGNEFEAEMPAPLYDTVLTLARYGTDMDTLPAATREDIIRWGTENALPATRVEYMVNSNVEWLELSNGQYTNLTPITWSPELNTTEYDFYESDDDGGDLTYFTAPDLAERSAEITFNTPASAEVYGLLSGGGPAPAAAHLSSDASRSAYAAAGALRDAGDARDDDLAWPDDWTWGRPARMLGNTHAPVYAPGTEPEDSDEEFPETSSAALPDEIDGVPVARPPGCGCVWCTSREGFERAGAALAGFRAPAEAANEALRDARQGWAEMVAYARAVEAMTTRVVEGSNSGHPLGILGFLDGARIPVQSTGFLGATVTDVIIDETRRFLDGDWVERYGDPDDPVWAPATAGRSPFAGDWSERLRTAPQPLTVTADPRICAPHPTGVPAEIAVGPEAADALEGPADIRQRIRNGDVVEFGADYMRVIRETVYAPRVIRPQRVIQ